MFNHTPLEIYFGKLLQNHMPVCVRYKYDSAYDIMYSHDIKHVLVYKKIKRGFPLAGSCPDSNQSED